MNGLRIDFSRRLHYCCSQGIVKGVSEILGLYWPRTSQSFMSIILQINEWHFCSKFWYTALCVYLHWKVSIGQYTKMWTSALIFFQLHYFRWQIFEENIWSLSLSVYIWPLESWTIIAIIRFNSILRTIWGRVEC